LKEFLIFFEGNSGQKKEKIRKLPSSEMEALAESLSARSVLSASDGRYYRKSIEIIDTYKSIDTFDTRKKYR
jgi:hypothetical protein